MNAGLADWHSFFALLGGVAATLIGAMFVVASLGTGFLTQDRAPAIGIFLTGTIGHLSAVLFGCAVPMVPPLGLRGIGLLVGLAGLAGLIYSGSMLFRIGRHNVDHGDRIWYAGLPFAGYAAMTAAGGVNLSRNPAGLDLLAIALALLLAAAIRNSWDMIVFLVTRPKGPE